MRDDLRDVREFYASRGGRVASRLLRTRIVAIWPDLSRLCVLGLGHTEPFLSLWQRQARLCVAGELSTGGTKPGETRIGASGRRTGTYPLASASCMAHESGLPFPDLSFDRILLCHALETSRHTTRLLREVWRVLKDDGRLMLMVPNRRGLWAHVENSPFGQGAPSSRRQIERLLAEALFRVERTEGALWLPPANLRPMLKVGTLIDQTGARLAPRFSGVLLIEAVKDVYAAVPAGKRVTSRMRALLPATMTP